jgi:DivIVA domain-containing protein
MPLTAEDVKNRQFSSTRFGRGYDEKEVDDFLDEVEAELSRLTKDNSDLRTKLALAEQAARQAPAPTVVAAQAPPAPVVAPVVVAPTPPPPPPVPVPVAASAEPVNEQALRMLSIAQRTADETVGEARRDAEKLLMKARIEADQLERETKEKHRATVGNLESERERLERKIDELRAFEREYRARLKAYLEGQLRDLDGNAGPAGAPAPGARPSGVPLATTAGITAPAAPAASVTSISLPPSAPTPSVAPPAGGPSMNGPAPTGAPQAARPATLFAPVNAPPVPGAPTTATAGPGSDPAPAGPPRQAPTGGYEVDDGPEVPPTNS